MNPNGKGESVYCRSANAPLSNRRRLMRLTLLPLLVVLLSGCATDRVSGCTKLAGPGWMPLGQPPANATQLLELENLPADSQLVWLGKGPEQVVACYYARGLTSPGCGGSDAYKFVQKNGHWTSQGQLLDFCDTGPS